MKLDGTELLAPTPFDAHEKTVRGPHTHSAAKGYQPAEYEPKEYPKAIAHDEATGEPIIAKDARHERQLKSAAKEDSE